MFLGTDYVEESLTRASGRRGKGTRGLWTHFLRYQLSGAYRTPGSLKEHLAFIDAWAEVEDVGEFVRRHRLWEPYRRLFGLVLEKFSEVSSVRLLVDPEEPEFRYIVFEVWAKDKEQAVRGEERFIKELVKYPSHQRLYFALSVSIRQR